MSDALGMTAQGLPTLQRTRIADDLERLLALVEEYSVERVLVGNPIGHSGGETAMSQRSRNSWRNFAGACLARWNCATSA